MKVTEKYKEQLILSDTDIIRGGFNYIDDNKKGILIENVNFLNFENLYARIIVDLYKIGIIYPDVKDHIDINKCEYFLDNKKNLENTNIDVYNDYRIHSNALFSKIGSKYQSLVVEYGRILCKELLSNNSNILYIDVDTIIYTGKLNLLDIDLPYNIREVKYLYLTSMKRYMYYSNGNIEYRGSGPRKLQDIYEFKKMIITKIREDKIEELGIF